MKKMFILFTLVFVMSLSVSPAQADDGLDVLYKYDVLDKNGDLNDIDNYGYNKNVPLKYYRGSPDTIMIPTEYTQDKEQFKSSWVATIHNIHIGVPKNEADFKKMYMERLDEFVDWNMNTMMFQIRPLLDSFYPSEINPTSEFLSGKQGRDVNYDALEWMIDVTHEAGLEYHAWLNPYRVTNSTSNVLIGMPIEESNKLSTEEYISLLAEKGVLAEDNFAVQNPEYVLRFDGKMILNPGYPETIDHVLETIDELIVNYDLDAIHFDDYFYPYDTNTNKTAFNKEDRDAFVTYGLETGEYEDNEAGLEQWRRDNVTGLVTDIHDLMTDHNQKNKTAIQLGISPFGIWEHKANDDRGSNTPTGSSSSYSNSIFADTRKWVDEELVDYMLPQIYWEFDQPAAPYAELARWWDSVAEGKNVDLYVGHPNYKMVSNWGNSPSFFNREEINNQLYFNQLYDNIKGSALYGYRDILKINTSGMTGMQYIKNETQNRAIDTLKADTFSVLPLTTEKPWLSHGDVVAVEDVSIDENNILTINDEVNDDARFYVIYKGESHQSKQDIIDRPENIIEKIFVSEENVYTVDLGEVSDDDVYYVSVLDRASVETDAVEAKSPVLVKIETEDLLVLIDKANELDENLYTNESYAVVNGAVMDAQAILDMLEADPISMSQEKVDEAVITLQSAMDALEDKVDLPVSDYETALAALRKADSRRNPEDIQLAKDLANSMDNGWQKNRLINRLNVIETQVIAAAQYAEAEEAVRIADASLNKEDITAARTFIEALDNGISKDRLMNRLLTIEAQINTGVTYEEALAALRTADGSRTSENIEIARDLASRLLDGWQKTRLVNRLAIIDVQEA